MSQTRRISESDWKIWRALRELALERYCLKILKDAAKLEKGEGTAHSRYLKLFELVKRRDKQLGDIFDNPRRSTAYGQIVQAVRAHLLTPEEREQFSDDTQAVIDLILGLDDR